MLSEEHFINFSRVLALFAYGQSMKCYFNMAKMAVENQNGRLPVQMVGRLEINSDSRKGPGKEITHAMTDRQ